MPFNSKITGIDPSELTEVSGDRGSFYVAYIGGKPELENGFFYGDEKHQFCFYADLKIQENNSLAIDVFTASIERFSGSKPRISKHDLVAIESNITKLFRERSFFVPSKPLDKDDLIHSVSFTWEVE